MRRTRPGFTLTELLVVIAIIIALTALSAAAYFRMAVSQQGKNTQTNLTNIAALVRQHYTRVIDDAKQEPLPSTLVTFAGTSERARVILIKMRLRQQFPMTFVEATSSQTLGGYTMLPEPAYVRALLPAPPAAPPNGTYVAAKHQAQTEMAACLFMALTARGRRGVSVQSDDLSNLDKKDTDQDGLMELVDGWGNPVSFFRWPYNNPNLPLVPLPLPLGTATGKFVDPEDPYGTLQPAWGNKATFVTWLGHTVDNKAVYPVIVSNGPDQTLGISDIWMTPIAGPAITDNIVVSTSQD